MCEILNIDVPAVLVLPHSTYNVCYCFSVSCCLIISHDVSLSHSVSYCLMMSHNVSCGVLFVVSHAVSYSPIASIMSRSVSCCLIMYHNISWCLTVSHTTSQYLLLCQCPMLYDTVLSNPCLVMSHTVS